MTRSLAFVSVLFIHCLVLGCKSNEPISIPLKCTLIYPGVYEDDYVTTDKFGKKETIHPKLLFEGAYIGGWNKCIEEVKQYGILSIAITENSLLDPFQGYGYSIEGYNEGYLRCRALLLSSALRYGIKETEKQVREYKNP